MIACGEGKGPRSGHESYEMELVKPIFKREVKQGKYIEREACKMRLSYPNPRDG